MATLTTYPDGTPRHVVRVAVFIPVECQLLDAATIDIIGSMGYEWRRKLYVEATNPPPPSPDMDTFRHLLPTVLIDLAPRVEIHYVGPVPAGSPIRVTANESILATDHYDDAAVAPGNLDIVLVPGPDPLARYPAGALDWLRRQAQTPGVDVLSVCTGIFVCGEAGLVKGKTVCGPRPMQDMIRQRGFGERELVGDRYRWVQDGNFWSAGGVTNGNDLVAAYCRATPRHFPRSTAEIAITTMDLGDRGREYPVDIPLQDKINYWVREAEALVAKK
ncbi:class I glutamine amidotransferase-like protein [Daldinia caldariorum]|uniref:class I glutamine amidotransferase-like protein n=1 Tax=Daldinia caldariorum TaxID=326644 RepID=UPI0020089560|nr:class I glutamine amidotransferase-like protein [Daldinia caldariorum]KAI1468891.1 class I glutamine amidotransferase-like protein [Daldinia caldariorum]